jgi:hypothetical protein
MPLACWAYSVEEQGLHTILKLSHGCDGSHSLLPRYTGWINVVDMGAPSQLGVSGALCSLDGKKAKAPNTSCTIPGVGFEWPLQFSLWYK